MSETSESTPTTELTNAYLALAKSSLENNIALTKQAVQENPEFSAKVQMPLSSLDNTQKASAQMGLSSALIHSWIYTDPTLVFEDGSNLEFKGGAWGIGLGGGVIWMGGYMIPSADLVGDIDFSFHTNPTFTIIEFFKNGNPAGSLAGGGINVQVGFFTGTGTFTAT